MKETELRKKPIPWKKKNKSIIIDAIKSLWTTKTP